MITQNTNNIIIFTVRLQRSNFQGPRTNLLRSTKISPAGAILNDAMPQECVKVLRGPPW